MRRWTDADLKKVTDLRAAKTPWEQIAQSMSEQFPGVSAQAIRLAYARKRPAPTVFAPRLRADNTFAGNIEKALKPEVLADRDRRAQLRSLRSDATANFFGDPLPGYSALDRQRARQ